MPSTMLGDDDLTQVTPTEQTALEIKLQAQRAVRTFQKMNPGLNAYARAITRNPRASVVGSSQGSKTDGNKILVQIPIELGENRAHVRTLCDQRDEQEMPLCGACAVRENVLIKLYHEMAHQVSKSFDSLSDDDRNRLVHDAMRAAGSTMPGTRMAKLIERLDNASSYVEAAYLISPYLKAIVNALEDWRVNNEMMVARPGTRKMFHARMYDVFKNGVKQPDGEILTWEQAPENSQATVGLLAKASGVDYHAYLSPRVAEAMDDSEIDWHLMQLKSARSVGAVYKLSIPVLERLRALGFCRDENDPEDEPQPQGDESLDDQPPADSQPTDSQDDGDDAEDGDGAQGETDDDSQDGSPEQGEQGEQGEQDGPDDAGEQGEQDGPDDAGEQGEQDDGQQDGQSTPEQEQGQQDGQSTPEQEQGEQDGPSTPEQEQGEQDGPSTPEQEQGEQDGPSTPEQGEHESDDDDEFDDDDDESRAWDDDDESMDNDEPHADPVDNSGEIEIVTASGTPEEAEQAVDQFGGHDKDGDEPSEEEQNAIDAALSQAAWFDGPAENVHGVYLHEWRKPTTQPNGLDRQAFAGWSQDGRNAFDKMPERQDESVIGPAVLRARRVFSDNKRGNVQRDLRAGSSVAVNRVRRLVTNGDPRVFQRRTQPKRKDYAISIVVDISGSTVGKELTMLKHAVHAQAEMMHRIGVAFSIHAHSGMPFNPTGPHEWGEESSLDIMQVKSFDEPWDSERKERLWTLVGFGANLDGHALEVFRRMIEQRPETDKVILYYTDGAMPAANHDEELTVLVDNIKKCERQGIVLVGVGIGTDSPSDHGLETVVVDEPSDVPKVIRALEQKFTGGKVRP